MREKKTLHIELSMEEFEELEEFKEKEGLTWAGVLKRGTGVEYTDREEELKESIAEEIAGRVKGEVRKAELERDAKVKEAETYREGLESLANSLERAIAQGAGGQTQQESQGGGGVRPEPITDEDENPTGQFKFDCPECGKEVNFETGENTVKCGNCEEIYTLKPTQ